MGKYQELCEKALVAMGGLENISFVTNCATRLRINYISKAKVDEEALKMIEKEVTKLLKQYFK